MQDKRLEKTVEKQVRKWVEDQGGVWIKLLADGRKGIPDNLLLLPPLKLGRYHFPLHLFVELKRPKGGILSPHQEKWLKDLTNVNQPAYVCTTLEHVQDVVEHHTMHIKRLILGARAECQTSSHMRISKQQLTSELIAFTQGTVLVQDFSSTQD